jgi:ABC-type sugar transport system permease subunit
MLLELIFLGTTSFIQRSFNLNMTFNNYELLNMWDSSFVTFENFQFMNFF